MLYHKTQKFTSQLSKQGFEKSICQGIGKVYQMPRTYLICKVVLTKHGWGERGFNQCGI